MQCNWKGRSIVVENKLNGYEKVYFLSKISQVWAVGYGSRQGRETSINGLICDVRFNPKAEAQNKDVVYDFDFPFRKTYTHVIKHIKLMSMYNKQRQTLINLRNAW